MKILLAGNIKSVFVVELAKRLSNTDGIEVYVLDFFNGWFVNIQEFYPETTSTKKANRIAKNLSFFCNAIHLKKLVKKSKLNFDVLNIHYIDARYYFFLPFFKKISNRIISSVYGADYYHFFKYYKIFLKKIFSSSALISFTNEVMEERFIKENPQYSNKTKILRFGLKNLELLSEIKETNKIPFKEKFNFPINKKTVFCGYSSSPFHQHLEVIAGIKTVQNEISGKVHLVFPMTYGGYTDQITKVEQALKDTKFTFSILTNYLSDKEIVELRLATDIMINLPVYDQFSGTMQENLFVGNTVITGTWMPYDSFLRKGIEMILINNIKEIGGKLKEIILSEISTDDKKNKEIIMSLSHWDVWINIWIDAYQNA